MIILEQDDGTFSTLTPTKQGDRANRFWNQVAEACTEPDPSSLDLALQFDPTNDDDPPLNVLRDWLTLAVHRHNELDARLLRLMDDGKARPFERAYHDLDSELRFVFEQLASINQRLERALAVVPERGA